MNEEIDWSKLTLPTSPFTIHAPPKANWKLHFGDTTTLHFLFYLKNPPNRFQRWMIKKVLGIIWEPIND